MRIAGREIALIAEVKTTSPFGYQAAQSWEERFDVAAAFGDMISIHTDPRWGGSFDLVKRARGRTAKPILAKGVHADDVEIERALEAGADWVLVVGRIPRKHLEQCLIEPRSIAELMTIPESIRAVWNSRDLDTGGVKEESYADARSVFSGWLCQASSIVTARDIDLRADAVLVGTHLETFVESLPDTTAS